MCHICIIIMYDLTEWDCCMCWYFLAQCQKSKLDQIRDCHHQQPSNNSPKVIYGVAFAEIWLVKSMILVDDGTACVVKLDDV